MTWPKQICEKSYSIVFGKKIFESQRVLEASMSMHLPPDIVHAILRECATDSVAVRAMEATCRTWRAAADDVNLWKVCL